MGVLGDKTSSCVAKTTNLKVRTRPSCHARTGRGAGSFQVAPLGVCRAVVEIAEVIVTCRDAGEDGWSSMRGRKLFLRPELHATGARRTAAAARRGAGGGARLRLFAHRPALCCTK